MLDCLLKLEGEERKNGDKFVEYSLQLHAHRGGGFVTWTVLRENCYMIVG